MNRTHTATQHGHTLSRVAGACPVPASSVSMLSSLSLVDATYPANPLHTEPIQWATGARKLFGGKREQRTAIT